MSHDSLQSRVIRLDNAVHHGGPFAAPPSMVIMHATEGDSAQSTIQYLNTTTDKKASYHYIIDRGGQILRMTEPDVIADHAGDSAWPAPKRATPDNQKPNGGRSVNGVSYGVAWANNGGPLTDAQLESALWLSATLMKQHGIPVERVLGHLEVSPGRKTDPSGCIEMEHYRQLLRDYLEAS